MVKTLVLGNDDVKGYWDVWKLEPFRLSMDFVGTYTSKEEANEIAAKLRLGEIPHV